MGDAAVAVTPSKGIDKEAEEQKVRALADELMPIFYNELRRIARRVRGGPSAAATLQTTALVNETYMRIRTHKGWEGDAHFLNAAALSMRHILVDNARERLAVKRGAGVSNLDLSEVDHRVATSGTEEMTVRLHDALAQLTLERPRLGKIVECRYFGGFDDETTARALNVSVRTVRRDWAIARAWLHRELLD